MANNCSCTTRISGPQKDVERFMDLVDSSLERKDGRSFLDFEKLVGPSTRKWLEVYHLETRADGTAVLEGSTIWSPPSEDLKKLSLRWPALTFEVAYGIEDISAGKFRCRGGCLEELEIENGYFRGYCSGASPGDAPIHHRWILMEVDADEPQKAEIEQALWNQAVFIRGEEKSPYRTTCYPPGEVVTLVEKLFPGVPVVITEAIAFTLDEETYLCSVHTMLRDGGGDCPGLPRIPEELRPLFWVADRDVALTDIELGWLVPKLIEDERAERVERIRNHIGRAHFDQQYGEAIRQRLARPEDSVFECQGFRGWFLDTAFTAERSVEFGYGTYGPTRAELELVLAEYAKQPAPDSGRVALIRHAIASPRWLNCWPNWDLDAEERRSRST